MACEWLILIGSGTETYVFLSFVLPGDRLLIWCAPDIVVMFIPQSDCK